MFIYEEVQREANAFISSPVLNTNCSIVKKMEETEEPFTKMSTQSILRYMSAVIRGIADSMMLTYFLNVSLERLAWNFKR